MYSQALGFVFLCCTEAFKNLSLKGFRFENADSGPSLYEPNSHISAFNL